LPIVERAASEPQGRRRVRAARRRPDRTGGRTAQYCPVGRSRSEVGMWFERCWSPLAVALGAAAACARVRVRLVFARSRREGRWGRRNDWP